VTEDRTIVFLDLTHGDPVAAEVIDRFIETVTAALDGRGRLVKTLGDGVLLETTDPATAIAVADAISHGLHVSDRMPEVTGGIATGPVLDRGDDVLGAVVNLAARLADLAPAGELRVTEPTARAAAAAGWQVEPLGLSDIRGLHEPVAVFRVVLCHPDDCVTDPVCGMRITPGAETPQSAVANRTVWFCSSSCRQRFRSAPDRYETLRTMTHDEPCESAEKHIGMRGAEVPGRESG
jgi:adenylate cyclase